MINQPYKMINLSSILGNYREVQCEGPSNEAEKYKLKKYKEDPPYFWETCVVNCQIDGSCTETLKTEHCRCSGFARIKEETFIYKVLLQSLI